MFFPFFSFLNFDNDVCWDGFSPVVSNYLYLVKIHGGMTDWHFNWILLWKSELDLIVVKVHFTSLYLYSSTRMYVATTPVYWSSMGFLSSVYFRSSVLLPMCNNVLRKINIRVCDSITFPTDLFLPVLPSENIIPWILGILFFDAFLKLLVYELLQHTTVVNSWDIWSLI